MEIINQRSLRMVASNSGWSFSGDDEIVSIGQDAAESADISGWRINAESLAELFQQWTYRPEDVDAAARYCKMKTAFLQIYG